MMQEEKLQNLLYEAFEHEIGGVQIYETALQCVRNDDLENEWQEYLEQTQEHVERLRKVLEAFELDPEEETPGRIIVRSIGQSLVAAMKKAMQGPDPDAAEIVAGECVVLAETKDHANWKLLRECAENLRGEEKDALMEAVEQTEDEEDEHLYHSMGWTRELWMQSLGMKAVLPPPEEKQDVKTAISQARAEKARKKMVPRAKRATATRAKTKQRKPATAKTRKPAATKTRSTATKAKRKRARRN